MKNRCKRKKNNKFKYQHSAQEPPTKSKHSEYGIDQPALESRIVVAEVHRSIDEDLMASLPELAPCTAGDSDALQATSVGTEVLSLGVASAAAGALASLGVAPAVADTMASSEVAPAVAGAMASSEAAPALWPFWRRHRLRLVLWSLRRK